MAYTSLTYGSNGDDVRQLQQKLVDSGYSVGSAGVDGIFGSATRSAVQKYQQDNGLTVNGIADDGLLTKLYGSGTDTGAAQTPVTQITPATPQKYDPSTDASYQQALSVLQAAQQNAPTYTNSYDSQLADLYDQIVNRDKFSYDLESDMLYKQYAQQYVNKGQMAMMDTQGQAAGLTGGYGSSYGQMAGQQAYDSYLQELNNIIPDLYDRAYSRYQDEGDALLQQYSMTDDMRSTEYSQYKDAYNMWLTERDYAQGLADQAYERGMSEWDKQYGVQEDNKNYIMKLISSTGYNPTDEELSAAGMTRAQAQSLLDRYTLENTPTTSGGGGSGGSGGSGSTMSLSDMANDLWNQGYSVGDINSALQRYYNANQSSYTVQDVQNAMSKYSGKAANLTINGKTKLYDRYL